MTEQINDPLPPPSSYLNTAVRKMLRDTVDERIQEIVQQTIESLNQNPPTWFTNQMNSVNAKLDSLETRFSSLETRFSSLETRFSSLERRMESGFNLFDYRNACLINMFRRMNGCKAIPVPFLTAEAIRGHQLPPIASVEDIDLLDIHDCQTYLRAYKVQFHPNETVKLKERLRDAIGLAVNHDVCFQFSGFHS